MFPSLAENHKFVKSIDSLGNLLKKKTSFEMDDRKSVFRSQKYQISFSDWIYDHHMQ